MTVSRLNNKQARAEPLKLSAENTFKSTKLRDCALKHSGYCDRCTPFFCGFVLRAHLTSDFLVLFASLTGTLQPLHVVKFKVFSHKEKKTLSLPVP